MTDQIDRVGRFSNDQGSSVLGGMASSSSLQKTLTNKQLKRTLKPYLKYLPKDLNKLSTYSTGQLEAIATRAVMKKRKYKPEQLRTSFNAQKFDIKRAKAVMSMEDPTQKQLRATKDARRHIRTVRQNRIVMKRPLWTDVPKEVRQRGANQWG